MAKLIDEHLADKSIALRDVVVAPTHIVDRQSTNIYASSDQEITVVLKYIHNHLGEKLTIGELQKLVPLSRRLLEIRFKRATGSAIYAYIMNLRMELLANRLLSSTDSIASIAFDLGLSDSKNLSRQFKQIKGCTPSAFRALNLVSL